MIAQAVLPDSLVESNVIKSLDLLELETNNVSNGIFLSGFSEKIMLKNSITGNNQFYSSPYNFNDFQEAFWNHGEAARYWQGYLVFLKPLLVFFDLIMIRNIFWMIFIGLLCALLLMLTKKSPLLAAALLVSVGLVSPYLMVPALSFVPVFIIMLIAAIVLLIMVDREKDTLFGVLVVFLLVGGCTSFFDFLTTPIITLGVPLLVYLSHKYWRSKAELGRVAVMVFLSCLVWGLSYTLVWASDWVIATLVTGQDVIGDAISQLLYRSGESTAASETRSSFTRSDAVATNLNYFPYLIWLIIVSLVCAVVAVATARSKSSTLVLFVAITVISVTPILWMLVTANHVMVHALFTHRGMLVSLFGCLLAIAIAIHNTRSFLKERRALQRYR
jgi:hypothetical protein